MHIPDGYLSPQTCAASYAVMIPFWVYASARIKRTLRLRQVPMLALAAAFSFLIMMFNVPIPGGTTGHAVGAVLIAILLGPWAALVAVSLALAVQALLFGDGGILAFGANCLNMAVIMPFAGWGIYRLLAGASAAASKRRLIAASLGGYIGLCLASIATAIMFGIQPSLFHDAAGHALYNPYPLKVALPIMAIEHLLVFGVVEAVATGLVIAFFQRTDAAMLQATNTVTGRESMLRKVAIALGVMILITPLGLYLPAKFAAGSAWGEWSLEEVKTMVGYLPDGMVRFADRWHALLPDYVVPGQDAASLGVLSFWYIVSALLGVGIILGCGWLVRRIAIREEAHDQPA